MPEANETLDFYSQFFTGQLVKANDPWISVKDHQPTGGEIVFMYSISNNEFSCDHFTLNRGGVPVTHWQPLVPPVK